MKHVLRSDHIISPLGFNTSENYNKIFAGESGITFFDDSKFIPGGYHASKIDKNRIDEAFSELTSSSDFTWLEKMMILAVNGALKDLDIDLQRTGLVVSTTKGNIDLLGSNRFTEDRVHLWKLAEIISSFFGIISKPVVVSNACISGALAVKTASVMLENEELDDVIVVAGDLVSEFVLAGFQSFQAISPEPCRPFSSDRQGISLGEAAAALVISKRPQQKNQVTYEGAFTANDANHISGPSRTGEGLFRSIQKTLEFTQTKAEEIDYLSAHGTATLYNDEMESIAFSRAKLSDTPVNSLKGVYGHTLGASALLEIIIARHCMLQNELFPSLNFTKLGTTKRLNVVTEKVEEELNTILKTASGFGGCNIAMLLKKN